MSFGKKTQTTSQADGAFIRAKKSLGQNFCCSEAVLNEIIRLLAIGQSGDAVWEVGPGKGALTSKLASLGCKLTLFEIDTRLKPLLEQSFGSAAIIWGDFLKLPVSSLPKAPENLLVCGNLPYYCATPIIKRFLEEGPQAERLVFLLQHEVAKKAAAEHNTDEYGYLSVHTAFFARASCHKVFGPECFEPRPKVNSSVLLIEPFVLSSEQRSQRLRALKYVSFLFGQRRKQALPMLKRGFSGINWAERFEKLGISEKARPENISPSSFLELFS